MKYTITQNALHFSNQVTTQSSKHLFYKFKFILGLALVFFFQNLSAQEIPFVDLKGENPSHNIRFVRNVGQLNNTDYETVNQITHHSVRATPRTFFQEDLISFVFE